MSRGACRCLLAFAALVTVSMTVGVSGQPAPKSGQWPTYAADLGNTRYSRLDQINASNFGKLEIAWRFRTDNLGPRPEFKLEGTPLMVNGVLFATAGTRRAVVALDPTTGELRWVHSIDARAPARTRAPSMCQRRSPDRR